MKRAERRALEREQQKLQRKATIKATMPAPAPADLRTQIVEDGQPYVDDPLLKTVTVYGGKNPEVGTLTVGYERVRLNWKRPVFDNAGNCTGLS